RIPADALNPLTLCLIGILAAIGSFAVQTWQGGLLALLPTVLLAPLAVRTLRGGALRLLPILLSAAGLAWTTALLGDAPSLSAEAWLLGLKEAARITAFVAPGVLALGSVEPTALGDALGQRLRAPARPVVAAVSALVRVGHLGPQWDAIVRTRPWRWTRAGSPARISAAGPSPARCTVRTCWVPGSARCCWCGRCWPSCSWDEPGVVPWSGERGHPAPARRRRGRGRARPGPHPAR